MPLLFSDMPPFYPGLLPNYSRYLYKKKKKKSDTPDTCTPPPSGGTTKSYRKHVQDFCPSMGEITSKIQTFRNQGKLPISSGFGAVTLIIGFLYNHWNVSGFWSHRKIAVKGRVGDIDFNSLLCLPFQVLKSLNELKEHELTHRGIRSYLCDQCGSAFVNRVHLSRHRRLHANADKTLQCDQCSATFAKREHLKRHQQTQVYISIYSR